MVSDGCTGMFSWGSRMMLMMTPLEPLAMLVSVAIFSNTITFIPIARLSLLGRCFVLLSFKYATARHCSGIRSAGFTGTSIVAMSTSGACKPSSYSFHMQNWSICNSVAGRGDCGCATAKESSFKAPESKFMLVAMSAYKISHVEYGLSVAWQMLSSVMFLAGNVGSSTSTFMSTTLESSIGCLCSASESTTISAAHRCAAALSEHSWKNSILVIMLQMCSDVSVQNDSKVS